MYECMNVCVCMYVCMFIMGVKCSSVVRAFAHGAMDRRSY